MNKFLVIRPIVTEKATVLNALRQYVFLVADEAAAPEIKKVIEALYKVKVTAVRVIRVKPKIRRLGRSVGTKPGYKKAIITVHAGQKIDLTT